MPVTLHVSERRPVLTVGTLGVSSEFTNSRKWNSLSSANPRLPQPSLTPWSPTLASSTSLSASRIVWSTLSLAVSTTLPLLNMIWRLGSLTRESTRNWSLALTVPITVSPKINQVKKVDEDIRVKVFERPIGFQGKGQEDRFCAYA